MVCKQALPGGPQKRPQNGHSPATEAANEGKVDVLKYLREEAGVDMGASSEAGYSPATHAAYFGKADVLKYLREEAGVDLSASDGEGDSPATQAAAGSKSHCRHRRCSRPDPCRQWS